MSKNLGLSARNLMITIFCLYGDGWEHPCYGMWEEEYNLMRFNSVTYWPCTRNHSGYIPKPLQYCSLCHKEDERIQKDIQDRIKKSMPKNTEESDEPTS